MFPVGQASFLGYILQYRQQYSKSAFCCHLVTFYCSTFCRKFLVYEASPLAKTVNTLNARVVCTRDAVLFRTGYYCTAGHSFLQRQADDGLCLMRAFSARVFRDAVF